MKKDTELRHDEESLLISASPEDVFAYVDDHKRFSSHMNQSSWMMGGGCNPLRSTAYENMGNGWSPKTVSNWPVPYGY